MPPRRFAYGLRDAMGEQPAGHDLGDVDEIDVEAIGEPGQRTFRLLAERGPLTASLWLEKEQLQALGLVIDQHVARLTRGGAPRESVILTLSGRFPAAATVDFKVGRMALGYDTDRRKFVFTAYDIEDPDETSPKLSCTAAQPQVAALSVKILEVVAAGRPRCPLCGAPIEGMHVCPASNGHVKNH
jgi:uncharacterized repeat protein (TIGR03847 family)